MEPEIKAFLKKILLSLFLGFFWMTINTTLGIYFKLAFIQQRFTVGNAVFYVWLIVSAFLFLRFIIKQWSKPIEGLSD